MRKPVLAVLIALTLIIIVPVSAGLGTTAPKMGSSPLVSTAVPGTEVHDNIAYIKSGYTFVDRGDAVDVVREGPPRYKTGTYTCPCNRKDGTGKCEMVFTTRRITCRTGSCVGVSCLLKAYTPTLQRR